MAILIRSLQSLLAKPEMSISTMEYAAYGL
jgi:hypothetical protein